MPLSKIANYGRKKNLALVCFAFFTTTIVACKNEGRINSEEAKRIVDRLKESSPKTTESVRIDDYVILGEKDLGIRATLLSWDSRKSTDPKLMNALAYQNAKTFACDDKAIHSLLADGFELTVMYASADRRGKLFTTVREDSCKNSE